MTRFACCWLLAASLVGTGTMVRAQGSPTAKPPGVQTPAADALIDFERARRLFQKRQQGQKLTADEEAYLRRAIEARNKSSATPGNRPVAPQPTEKTGLKPLDEMTAADRYQGEDGGLYGGGQNQPPAAHQAAAVVELAKITPLNAAGQPDASGRVVFVSISMSNATQEFSRFKQFADAEPTKASRLTIVDCAQGGQAMAEWVSPDAPPWREAARRITAAGVTAQQVQVAWIKLANKGPSGNLADHGKKLQRDTQAVIHNAKTQFPNLRVAYLSSRIYGGYARSGLNPEPFAYESAFVVRWLIQDQMQQAASLNFDVARGPVNAPLLLWGPYLWADGVMPRASDQLRYTRDDLASDGTHPSESGRDKVAKLMLNFYKTNPLAQPWFVEPK